MQVFCSCQSLICRRQTPPICERTLSAYLSGFRAKNTDRCQPFDAQVLLLIACGTRPVTFVVLILRISSDRVFVVSEFCDPAVPHKDLSLRDESIRRKIFPKQQKIGVASGTDCPFSRIHQQTLCDVFREERERLFERKAFRYELAERF